MLDKKDPGGRKGRPQPQPQPQPKSITDTFATPGALSAFPEGHSHNQNLSRTQRSGANNQKTSPLIHGKPGQVTLMKLIKKFARKKKILKHIYRTKTQVSVFAKEVGSIIPIPISPSSTPRSAIFASIMMQAERCTQAFLLAERPDKTAF